MSVINWTITGYLALPQSDWSDVGADSDEVPLNGTVALTPVTADRKPLAVAPGYTPPAVFAQPVTAFTGYVEAGVLKTAKGGSVGLRVPANDPVLGLEELWYRLDFDLWTAAGQKVKIDSQFVEAPSTNTTADLSTILTATGSSVSAVVRQGSYTEDIIDSGSVGRALMRAETAAPAWTALGMVPSNNLPSYVDDVLEFTNLAGFPATGETGKIYVDRATGDTYRWSGSQYIRISDRRAPAPTGVAATDVANLAAALAADTDVRVDGGTYAVGNTAVTVPAGDRLTMGSGAKLRFADNILSTHTAGQIRSLVVINSDSAFVGTLDGNRDNQDKTQFNATNGNGQINGLVCYGTAQAPKTNIYVDATITGVAGTPVVLGFVDGGYVRIRAKDCGGAINIHQCKNLVLDIEYDDQHQKDWRTYQHAVDFNGCENITARVIMRNMDGQVFYSGSTLLFGSAGGPSGLTITDCDNISLTEAFCSAVPNSTASLGFSFLGVRNMTVGNLTAIGCTEGGLEIGSLVDSEFSDIYIDGRYATVQAGLPYSAGSFGINVYNNAFVTDQIGRTWEYTRNVKFNGGTVMGCRGMGLWLSAAQHTRWTGFTFQGNAIGALIENFEAWNADYSGAAPAAHAGLRSHVFVGCDFRYNESGGVHVSDGADIHFHSCRFTNNGQVLLSGAFRIGGSPPGTIQAGLYCRGSNPKTGLIVANCVADDNQAGVSGIGFLNRNAANRIAVDRVEKFGVGQTITISGVGFANNRTRINAIERDELVLEDAVSSWPAVNLTGTISTSGTTVTGTGTAFLTELTGRAYLKVGSQYRRIRRVRSNTEATIESAFSSNLSGASATIEQVTITATASQTSGFFFNSSTISPVLIGALPTGNTVQNVFDQTVSPTKLVSLPYSEILTPANSVDKTLTVRAPNLSIVDNTDVTKVAKFALPSIPTATTRTFTLPSGGDRSLAALEGNNTWTSFNVFTTDVTVGSPTGTGTGLNIDGADGVGRPIWWRTAGNLRWTMRSTSETESTADAGSNLEIQSRTDAGAGKTVVLRFNRADDSATFGGQAITVVPSTVRASLRLPHGTAPTSPVNGDVWTTTSAMFARINGTTQQIATSADIAAGIAALVNSAPAALDTLNELAAALGNDANYATTVTNALAAKAPLVSPAFTTPNLGTPTAGDLVNCTFPTLNQNTTGSAATLTTARTVQTDLASTSAASFNGSVNITPGVTGTLAVGNGGTGATTLTGVLKGNGTSALSAAVAGTDFVAPGGALGTPSSGTLTNCTGLPVAGITASTTAALGVGSLEVGHASDTSLTRSAAGVLAVEGVTLATVASPALVTGALTLPAVAGREYAHFLDSGADPTLPTAVSNTSVYRLKNRTTAAIQLKTTSNQTIDGNATFWLLPRESVVLVSDNANWEII